jgi:hypothetical protein
LFAVTIKAKRAFPVGGVEPFSYHSEQVTEVGVSPQEINGSEVDFIPAGYSDGMDTWDTWSPEEIAEVASPRRDFDELGFGFVESNEPREIVLGSMIGATSTVAQTRDDPKP